MAEEHPEARPELTPDELEQQRGEPLPDRSAMSVVAAPGDPHAITLPVEPPAEA